MPSCLPKKGDMIIDFDQISVVSKIENDLVYYCSLIKDTNKGNISSSIPLNNFSKAGIRSLLTKEELKAFMKNLAKEEPLNIPSYSNKNNNNNLKEFLYLNDPHKTGQLLIYLNQRQKTPIYSKADQLIFDQAMDHLCQEVAVVSDISLDLAKKQILTAISKNPNTVLDADKNI
jgi:RNA polymerase-interacting CarD/CdnL/TRCF family regulator